MGSAAQDWFSAHAAKTPPVAAMDWFARNSPPPGVPRPSDSYVQQAPMSPTEQGAANVASGMVEGGKLAGRTAMDLGNQLYESSAPHIAQQIAKKLKGQPNELEKVPQNAVMTFLGFGGIPEGEIAEAGAAKTAARMPEIAAKSPEAVMPAAEAKLEPAPAPKTAAPSGQFTHQVDAKSLEALKSATGQVVDQAVPSSTNRGINLWTKAQIEAKLKAGDVAGAEKVLDQAAAKSNPSYTAPERPEIVPATQNIRENEALSAKSERAGRTGGFAEARDDAGVAQEMRADLDTHGYRAESEARREFIARNSNSMTKGEMAKAVKVKSTPAEDMPDDLQTQLQKMLDAARRMKK